jgi:hypothetical protein
MDTGEKEAPITRREFNNALVFVWTAITLAFSTTMFSARAPMPVNLGYFVIAFAMVINYTVASLRGGGDVARTRSVVFMVLLAAVALAIWFFAGRSSH